MRAARGRLQAFHKKYFWWEMKKTIMKVIGACEVSLSTKYDRHPPRGRQEKTPTADTPLTCKLTLSCGKDINGSW